MSREPIVLPAYPENFAPRCPPRIFLSIFRARLRAVKGSDTIFAAIIPIFLAKEFFLVGLTIQPLHGVDIPGAFDTAVEERIDGKDVDIYAYGLRGALFDEHCRGVFNLGVDGRIAVVRGKAVQPQAGRRGAVEFVGEAVVVGARHQQVDVVVPWDEAPVAHGSYQRAVGQRIA